MGLRLCGLPSHSGRSGRTMSASVTSRLGRVGVAWGVVLTGLAVGLIWGALSPPARVQALDSLPRVLTQVNPGPRSVVVNSVLYDVVTYLVDLPVIMNNVR
jgi:hypothetical protein